MASTYTNGGIEKIGSGEQAGTWGTTTNNNLDIIDNSINGVKTLTLTGTTDTFTVTDGTVSDAGAKVLVLGGSPTDTHTLTLAPEDADKVHLVQNGTNQTVNISQGSGANASLVAGEIAWIFCDGAGSSAAVTKQTISSSPAAFTVGTDLTVTGDASVGDDLSLASDGAVLNFGADSEIKITHVADSGLTLKHAATADDKFPTLSLAAGDTDIAVNDKLGVINFIAPDEAAGTDAILVGAGIEAVSEGDFSASNNATKLVFKTGASEAASEKMSLSSGGNLAVSGNITVDGQFRLGSNTDTRILVADGTHFQERAVSGDITISNTGVVTIANNAVETAMIADSQITVAKLAGSVAVIGMSAKVTVSSGNPAITASVNTSGITDSGVGDYTIAIATDYANANYAVSATTFDDDGTNRNIGELTVNTQAADTILVKSFRPSASENSARGSFDPDGFYVMSNAQ
jgi:hypothetical protein